MGVMSYEQHHPLDATSTSAQRWYRAASIVLSLLRTIRDVTLYFPIGVSERHRASMLCHMSNSSWHFYLLPFGYFGANFVPFLYFGFVILSVLLFLGNLSLLFICLTSLHNIFFLLIVCLYFSLRLCLYVWLSVSLFSSLLLSLSLSSFKSNIKASSACM